MEMYSREIIAKSISRLSYEVSEDKATALTARTILNQAATSKNTQTAIERFKNIYTETLTPHIRIIDGLITVEKIKDNIKKHKRITSNTPIIFIDYLQAMKLDGNRDKREQIDSVVTELRILAAEHDTPIFVVSSLNRDSYRKVKSKNVTKNNSLNEAEQNIGLADFKESGGIEYGADIILALQHEKNDNDNNDKQAVRLRVLKNRLGKTSKDTYLSFDFFYKFNFFKDNGIKEIETKKRISENIDNRSDKNLTPISEDEIPF